MKPHPIAHAIEPQYPTRRRLLALGALLGASALGVQGCATGGTGPADRPDSISGGTDISFQETTGGVVCEDPGPQESYRVQRGDTLYAIARTALGDSRRWPEIASANPGLTPRTLRAGMTIVLPPR